MSHKTEKILKCLCSCPEQDQEWGQGMRVHVLEDNAWRCTACGRTTKA